MTRGLAISRGPKDWAGRPGQVTAITSGRVGAGKTTLATNIAIEWARCGRGAVLADARDLARPAGPLLLLPARQMFAVSDRTGRGVDGREPCGLRVLSSGPCASGAKEGVRRSAAATMEELTADGNDLLVDCPSCDADLLYEVARRAHLLTLVVTPDQHAIEESYATLKWLCERGISTPLGLVLNRCRNGQEAAESAGKLSRAASRFLGRTAAFHGGIPEDRAIGRAWHAGRPVVLEQPGCPASHAIRAIARRWTGPGRKRGSIPEFWLMLAQVFL